MAEWLKATDCKSVLARVRWFESTSAQIFYKANCDEASSNEQNKSIQCKTKDKR